MLDKLLEIEKKFNEVEMQLQDMNILSNPKELARLGKIRSDLEPQVEAVREYTKTLQGITEAKELLNDPEMGAMATEELAGLETKQIDLEEKLKLMLVPKDPNDDKPVIIEIRPAAGGDEAGLFASQMFRAYVRYAERNRWTYEVLDHEDTGIGGISKVVFKIDAIGAYSQLKYESGVHRVQRVPATESGGRIHTSTITVAVLPEAEAVDLDIRQDDLEISTFCSSSAGGQHMQKNETAIRIIHKPSGLVVTCQNERSQNQNKLKAMEVLRARLYQLEQEKLAKERVEMRKGQIGSGDRSEKIRTYNFPQSRVTDHRILFSVHNILDFMDGGLQDMINALTQKEIELRLQASMED